MKHVISIENAKKLQELGVVAESYFYIHVYSSGGSGTYPTDRGRLPTLNGWSMRDVKAYHAYTVGELGEMLQKYVTGTSWNPYINNGDGGWLCKSGYDYGWHSTCADNEADVRAQMLIYLIEQGHIKAEEL